MTKNIANTIDAYINKNWIFCEFTDRIYIIKFADKLIEQTKKVKKEITGSLFDDNNDDADNEFSPKVLLEHTSKEITKEEFKKIYEETIKNNYTSFEEIDKFEILNPDLPVTQFIVPKLMLFQNTSLGYLLSIINFVCRCKVDHMEIKGSSREYYEYISVGNKPLHLIRNFAFVNDFASNAVNFTEWYQKNYNHIMSVMNKVDTFEHFVTNISLILFPTQPITTDIVKIFNKATTLNNWWSKKIILHDSYVDLSKGTLKTQYIKQGRHANEYNKHITSKTNTVTFTFKVKLKDCEINFNSLDITKEGLFTMNFSMNILMSIEEIVKQLHKFIESKANEYFGENAGEYTLIEFLMYRSLFINFSINNEIRAISPKDFTIGTGNYSTIYSFAYTEKQKVDVNSVRLLFQFDEIKSRFNSKTSTCLNFYSFANMSTFNKFNQYGKKLTQSIVNNLLLPELKFDDADQAINVFANKFSSLEELEFALNFSFPIYSLESHLKNVPEDKVEAILARLRNLSIKQNLKILQNNDPVLFGPRKVPGGDSKAYSALVQQKNQRPSIISETDYELIKQKYPESVVHVKNLSNYKQRLHLVCPYQDSQFVNFHEFDGQPCIVRCTTRKTNITQMTSCAKSLGVTDENFLTNSSNSAISHSIIKYTPNLGKGRKCRMPGSFQNLYPFLTCCRASDITKNIASLNEYLFYNFGGYALVIKPNTLDNEFEILTELDISGSTKYFMVIQPTDNENNKYVPINNLTGTPFCINEAKELFDFIKEHYKSNISHRRTIQFINKYIWDGANDRIDSFSSLNEYIKEVTKNNFKCVIHPKTNQMLGLLKNNETFYTIPPIYWYYSNSTISIHTNFVLDKILNKYISFADINSLIKHCDEKRLLIDINDNIVAVYIDENLIIPCKPFKNNNFYDQFVEKKPDSVVDVLAYLTSLLSTKNPAEIMFDFELSTHYKYLEIIQVYLQKFFRIYPNWEELKEPCEIFIKMVEQMTDGFSKDDTDHFKTIPYSSNVIDIYNSKLNKKTFEDFIRGNPYFNFNSKNDLLDLLCESLIKNTNLQYLPIETIVEKEFI